MSDVPDSSNFFSSLHTRLSREEVAALYGAIGWEVRRCTWVDYEITCPWAELVIESDSPILMHGPVADVLENADRILETLRNAKIPHGAECLGDDDMIVKEFRWGIA